MSFAYQPFYTGDYYRDTRHLSMLQHGAYRQLLDHCWDQRGPLPLDPEKCYRICGAVSKEEQDAVRTIISEFFVQMEDGHYSRRMQREIERCNAISNTRSIIGKLGAQARAKQLPSKSQAITKQLPLSPSPSPSPSPSLEPQEQRVSSAPASRKTLPTPPFLGDEGMDSIPARALVAIAPDWELPEAWGKDAERLGWSGGRILKEAERFRQYWVSGKGQGKRRTLKGWRQSWSNWLGKAEAMA